MENASAILPAFANWQILTLGVILITLEVTLLNFFILLWFGIAALIIGAIGFFYPFTHGEYQLLAIAILGTLLLLAFRKKLLESQRREQLPLETFEAGETGTVVQHKDEFKDPIWMIEYHGSWWRIANPSDHLKVGQIVKVKKVENNQVWIEEE
ncbi:NfeD family protein [Galenea microaerophila]